MSNFVDRLRATASAGRTAVGGMMLGNRKAVQDARFIPTFLKAAWTDIAFRVLAKEGYKANAAVYACVQAWAQSFPEPELHVRKRDRGGAEEWLWEHPARLLMERPNAAMGEDEFWAFVITYLALGGNCYCWKERDRAGRPVAIWPLHDGQMEPVPGGRSSDGFVSHYLYDSGDGRPKDRVEVTEVVQLRWAIDPLNPVRGLSPLVAASRSVDTANEAMRYQFALLKNDAVVSTLVSLKEPVGPTRLAELKRQFKAAFSGDNRGDAAFVEGADITISRLGSTLQELAIEALLNVPEANIAAAFEVPPGLAGLNVALQRPQGLGSVGDTAVQEFTQRRLVPRWRRVASQFTAGLLRDFDKTPGVAYVFDTSTVQALREDEGALITTVNAAITAGWMLVSEGRERAGLPDLGPSSRVFLRGFNVMEVPADGAPEPVTVTPVAPVAALPPPAEDAPAPALPDAGGAKAATMPPFPLLTVTTTPPADGPASAKAAPRKPSKAELAAVKDLQARRERLARAARTDVAKALDALQARVVARVEADGAGAAPKFTNADAGDLHKAVNGHAARVAESAFGHASGVVGKVVPFRPDTPGVDAIFKRVAERVTGIDDTTRDRLRTLVDAAAENEWSIGELVKHIRSDESGIFNAARAELIARTETGTVLNQSAAAAYRASGRVKNVRVFDGDSDADCAAANGSIWTLDEADANPIQHPQCVRAFAPVVDLGDEE